MTEFISFVAIRKIMKQVLLLIFILIAHISYAQKADSYKESRALMNDGDILFGQDRFVDALAKYEKAFHLVENSDSAHLKAELLLDIGLVYDYIGDFEKSLQYYQRSFQIMDSLDDKIYVAAIQNNIGTVFFMWEEYDQALQYYLESLEVEKEMGNKRGIADSYQNIGTAYRNLNKPDSALHYFDESLTLYLQLEDSLNIATNYVNLANLYADDEDYHKAIFYVEKAYDIQTLIDDKYGLVYSLNNLGLYYLKLSDYSTSKQYFLKSVNVAEDVKSMSQLLFSYEKLSELSSMTGDYKSAYEYLSNAVLYRDSVFSADARRQMAEMQTRFEVAKKNDEIQIQKLTIEQQDSDLKRANLIRAIVFIGLIISILFSAFLIWMYFQKRRAYQVLLLQNIELARLEQSEKAHNPVKESLVKDIPDTKYQKSSLTDDQKEAIYEKLLEMMEYGRVFLNHDLSVEDLADKLDTNRRYLSQVVNELHGSNFSTFINEYRVKEARRLLLDPEKHHFSLEGIAHAAGFNSRISFNNAFKKITGLTPAYFQKSSMIKGK